MSDARRAVRSLIFLLLLIYFVRGRFALGRRRRSRLRFNFHPIFQLHARLGVFLRIASHPNNPDLATTAVFPLSFYDADIFTISFHISVFAFVRRRRRLERAVAEKKERHKPRA